MISSKEIVLLEVLLKHPREYLSSQRLAEEISSSDRTARKYLHQLSSSICKYGAIIDSKKGYGYQLRIDRPLEFEAYWQNLKHSRKSYSDISQVEVTLDRERYILNKLLFEHSSQSVESLCQDLFISRTTLHTTLTEIRQKIKAYHLSLSNIKKEVRILGKEEAIRHFMMDYFFGNSFKESIYTVISSGVIAGINLEEIMIIVLEEFRVSGLKLSDFIIHNLVLHIALMIHRVQAGYPLEFFEIDEIIQISKEYQVAHTILNRLEKKYQFRFPDEEANYIALHLNVKHSLQSSNFSGQFSSPLCLQIKESLKEIRGKIGIPLDEDTQLLNGLLAHMIPFKIRLENGIQLMNPLREEISRRCPSLFQTIKTVFSQMQALKDFCIRDDEWTYIALHIMAAIERHRKKQKLRVLVVCATGYGSALMLKSRLEKEFSESIQVLDVVSYHEISDKLMTEIDVIISSIDLSHLTFLTPVIHVGIFLGEEDIYKIRNYISSESPLDFEKETATDVTLGEAKKIVKSVFSKDKILYFSEEIDKEEAIARMISCLNESVSESFVEEMTRQIKLRENYSSIVFGDLLAFPHPAVALGYEEQVVVGICQHPIQWNEEKQMVEFIFLLSPSKGKNANLAYISPSLVKFVQNKGFQEKLKKHPTYSEVVHLFTQLIKKG